MKKYIVSFGKVLVDAENAKHAVEKAKKAIKDNYVGFSVRELDAQV